MEFECLQVDDLHEVNEVDWSYIDDSTGKVIDSKLVEAARNEELRSFGEMGVYVYVKREVAKADKQGKMVGVRWVDIMKGDECRSRLVAQEFAKKDDRDDLFASTPPLTASTIIISQMCPRSRWGPKDCKLMILDIKRAFCIVILRMKHTLNYLMRIL